MSNVETVKAIYEAFSRGDVPAILSHLAEDVEWEYGASPTDVPWLQPRRGRTNVVGFFESLQALEFHRFEATHVLGEGDIVLAAIDVEATVKATERRLVLVDEVHVWRFNEKGQVQRYRHADTQMHGVALRP